MLARAASSLCALSWALLLPTMVWGQGSPSPNAQQIQLYLQALEDYQRGDLTLAQQKLTQVLEQGEFNLFHLALAKVKQQRGDCQGARGHLERALQTPAVKDPGPAQVKERVLELQAALRNTCEGTLVVRCSPGAQVSVDHRAPHPCPPPPLSLTPGGHQVRWQQGEHILRQDFTIHGLEETSLEFKSIQAPAEPPPPSAGLPWPWITVGAGAATLTTALALDLTWVEDRLDRFEQARLQQPNASQAHQQALTSQRVTSGVYLAGGLLTLGGLAWWLWPVHDAPEGAGAGLRLGPGALEWTAHW